MIPLIAAFALGAWLGIALVLLIVNGAADDAYQEGWTDCAQERRGYR